MRRIHHLTLALIALLFSTAAVAQTQKGNLMVGASLTDFGVNFQKDNTEFKLNLQPRIGWFIKDDLALGGYARLGLTTAKGAGTQTNYGVGAFARYFIQDKNVRQLEFSKRTRFFLEAEAGFGGTSNSKSSASTNGLDLGFGPGLSYFITPNVALEALVKYNLTVGFGSAPVSNRLGFALGFQIYLPGARARQLIKEETGRDIRVK